MLTPKINPDFNATVTYKRATIGPEGTIKQVALTNFPQAPTEDDDPQLPQRENEYVKVSSPLHVIACSDQFTHADFNGQTSELSHRCLTDEDILVTVTTADGVYAHTYNRTQWQEEEIDAHTTRAVLPLSVIRAKLVVQADNTRTVLDDLIAAKSKKIALELDDNYTLRNDFTVQIEYYGVYEDGDADYTCLYDLYGFNTSSDNVSYNTICLCDGTVTTPTILALRFFGYGITLPVPATDGFSLFVKVFETSEAVNVIELDKPYVSDYSKHLEDATTNITNEHKELLADSNGRAEASDYNDWDGLNPAKTVSTNNPGPYSQLVPKVQVYDSNDAQDRTYGVSTRYAGPGYTYDAHIWYYWNETKIKEVLLDKFNLSLTSVSQSFVGFDSRTGSFLYTFVEADGYSFIIVSGSNNYHYVDIYQLDNASEISTLFKTELSGEGAAHQYRAKVFRWYGTLYLSDVAEGNVYYINPGPAEAPIPVWQDITKNDYTNYLYHEIRVFKQCTITNASGDDHVYCTEFSDLGDVAIKYENGELSYVGLAPKTIDGTGSETAPEYLIDANNAFRSVLNYYDVDYISQQNTLELMYRQSAYHIKYLVDHHYKIIYLGPKYSVGYDADNQMYLFLMKDFIHTDAPRRVRIGEDLFNYCILSETQRIYSNYPNTVDYNTGYIVDGNNNRVEVTCGSKDAIAKIMLNGDDFIDPQWNESTKTLSVQTSSYNRYWGTGTIDNNTGSEYYSWIKYNGTYPLTNTHCHFYIDRYRTRSNITKFCDNYLIASDGQYLAKITDFNQDTNPSNIPYEAYLPFNTYNFLDVDRGVFIIKSTVSGVDGYVRYLKGAQ